MFNLVKLEKDIGVLTRISMQTDRLLHRHFAAPSSSDLLEDSQVRFPHEHPCNIQRFFSASKIENFHWKKMIFSALFLLKTQIVGTR